MNKLSLIAGAVLALITLSTASATEHRVMQCKSRTLAGHKVSGLYLDYIGPNAVLKDGSIGSLITVDFNVQLKNLWTKKIRISRGNPVVRQMATQAARDYDIRRATHLTLHEYIGLADREAHLVHSKISWNAIGDRYFRRHGFVDMRRLTLLREATGTIGGRDLIAYALTELMPGKWDGVLNREMLDFLLRNAGREFVEHIPAVYDRKTSFGPYQFTEYALYDGRGGPRGASIPNCALPKALRIDGSVIKLHGNLHFRAAYLNAIHNLALLLQHMSAKELQAFSDRGVKSDKALMEYVAVAHHAPYYAVKAGRRWLDHGAKKSFMVSAGGPYLLYAQKTASNYDALH
jgi:hypothetical protein